MTEIKNVNSLCRCCHAVGNFKGLDVSYFTNGVKEIFSEMLRETFEVIITPLSQVIGVNTYCICPPCAARLRDAFIFKNQVVACEQKLLSSVRDALLFKEDVQLQENVEKDNFSVLEEEYLNIYSEESEQEQEVQFIDDSPQQSTSRPKEKPKFPCNLCQKIYVNTASLDIHMKKHSGEASHSCFLCEAKFFKNKDLSQHIDDCHREDGKYACTSCEKRYDKAYVLKNHVLSHLNEKFICDYCNKEYTRKKNLKEHIKLHTGQNFKCEVCEKLFFGRRQLSLHMPVHTEEKLYVCELCGKRFRQECSVKRHFKLKHDNNKPLYPCQICGKKFWNKSYLAVHERIHIDERPYSCEVCKKDFKETNHLRQHMKVHTGEKPYTCRYCGKQFAHFATFMLHERRHNGVKPYVCKVCKKAFVDSSSLKIHVRLHTDVRPFPCEVCDRRFNENGQLKRHMRSHTGERDACKICGKRVKEMYTHMKAMHPDQYRPRRVLVINNTPHTMADYDLEEL